MILSSFFQPTEEDAALKNTNKWLPSKVSNDSANNKVTQLSPMQKYEQEYEQELSSILSKVVGVSDVDVVVNLDSSEEEVIQYDVRENTQTTTETDTKGGTRSIQQNNTDRKTTVYRDGGGEKPLVVKKVKPKVRGVLVVARGVEDLQVKATVIQAIQRTLDVPMHRIEVLPKG